MRQQVNALAVVSFDAPAELSRAELIAATTDALRTGSFATVEPTGVEVRGLMEEAAIYNNNGDQWEVGEGRTLRQGGDKFRLVRLEYKDGEAVTGWSLSPVELNQAARDVAEALNFMAGRVLVSAAGAATLNWLLAMAEEAIAVRAAGDDPDDTPDVLAMHREEFGQARALVASLIGGAA